MLNFAGLVHILWTTRGPAQPGYVEAANPKQDKALDPSGGGSTTATRLLKARHRCTDPQRPCRCRLAGRFGIRNHNSLMMKSFSIGRRPGVLLAGMAGLLASATLLLMWAKTGSEIVGVLTFPLGVVGVAAAAIWGLVPRSSLAEWARTAAARETRLRERDLRQALADAGDPDPASLRFRSPNADQEPELVGWRDDAGNEGGTLPELAGYYQRLQRGRMVIEGRSGAGKTVAAGVLVRDLNRALLREYHAPEVGVKRPVALLLSLPGWTPNLTTRRKNVTTEKLADMLDRWIVNHLVSVHRVPRPQAHRLVAEGWIVPVLDSLDEMDPAVGRVRPRAAAVVRALNAQGTRPVVLVCRQADYARMAITGHLGAGEAPVLQDAQQVVLEDLTHQQIREYLEYRFPKQPRWKPVLNALRCSQRPGLARVLGRPWLLFLAIHAYHAPDTDPSELLHVPLGQLRDHLLERIIPAAAARHPRPEYQPAQVRTWLATFARHLRDTSRSRGWPHTDLHVSDLWPVAGARVPRYLAAASTAVAHGVVLAVALVWLAAWSESSASPPRWGILAALLAALMSIPVGTTLLRQLDPSPPISPDRRLIRQGSLLPGMARTRYGLVAGGLLGVGVALTGGSELGARYEVAVVVGLGFMLGFAVGYAGGAVVDLLWRIRSRLGAGTARTVVRRTVVLDLAENGVFTVSVVFVTLVATFTLWAIGSAWVAGAGDLQTIGPIVGGVARLAAVFALPGLAGLVAARPHAAVRRWARSRRPTAGPLRHECWLVDGP